MFLSVVLDAIRGQSDTSPGQDNRGIDPGQGILPLHVDIETEFKLSYRIQVEIPINNRILAQSMENYMIM